MVTKVEHPLHSLSRKYRLQTLQSPENILIERSLAASQEDTIAGTLQYPCRTLFDSQEDTKNRRSRPDTSAKEALLAQRPCHGGVPEHLVSFSFELLLLRDLVCRASGFGVAGL